MNKIEPQYVSFEIAKLLKEKGFGDADNCYIQLPNYYDIEEVLHSNEVSVSKKYNTSPNHLGADTIDDFKAHLTVMDNSLDDIVLAPEIWQVVEWLRLKRNIWIECHHITTFNINRFHIIIWDYKDKSDYKTIHCDNDIGYKVWDTPKEAYLAAIDYTLKELI